MEESRKERIEYVKEKLAGYPFRQCLGHFDGNVFHYVCWALLEDSKLDIVTFSSRISENNKRYIAEVHYSFDEENTFKFADVLCTDPGWRNLGFSQRLYCHFKSDNPIGKIEIYCKENDIYYDVSSNNEMNPQSVAEKIRKFMCVGCVPPPGVKDYNGWDMYE